MQITTKKTTTQQAKYAMLDKDFDEGEDVELETILEDKSMNDQTQEKKIIKN